MFFKRLEMTGFKSFATRTVIDFLPGITVIVGPNGCGKSNIFDAVRWALGEQRPRVLRGQRMGDVIFSGSASYKPQSMASVSLTINNEDRRLPIDFSELQIARRLYKVGDGQYESEYLLNRTPCRLRQITDLFLDTGIGTSSYSIMEQSQVEFLINARPTDRRYIFDEAVGISKYRARREEALRKLERTEADLVRLADILAEIKSRLRSLKIQANRAERYKQLVAQLRELERDLLLLGYRDLVAEKRSVDERYDDLNAALQAVAAKMAQVEKSLLDKQVEADRLDRQGEQRRARRQELATELERLESRRSLLRERIETTEAQMRRDESQIASLRSRRDQLNQRRERLAAEIEQAGRELAQLEAEQESRRRQFDELVRSQSDARERLAQLREQARRAVEEKSRRENELRIASVMKQQAEENLRRARSQLETARQRMAELSEKVEQLERDRAERRRALERLEGEMARLEAQRRQLDEQVGALERQRESAMRERHEAESRRKALRALQENFEGFVRGVRELMAAAARGEIGGVVGIVADLFQPRPEDELVIEAALGGHLQDIVVSNRLAAREAMGFLRRARLGRATFLPLDSIEPHGRDPLLEAVARWPGVVGVAADLVSCEPHLRPVAEALLGRTIVVEDSATAEMLRGHGHNACFVARDGTVIGSDGQMTGGHVRASGLLGRRRQIRELAERVERLDRKIADLDSRIRGQSDAIEATENKRAEVAAEINSIRSSLVQIESGIERLDEDRADAARAVEQLDREVERLAKKIAEYDESIERHRRSLEESDARSAALHEQLRQVETARESQSQQLTVLQEALAHMMAQVSASRERLEASQRRLAELDDEIARCDEQIAHSSEELDGLSRMLDQACAEIERTAKRREQLSKAVESLDREIAQASSVRESVADQVRQLQHELHALHRERNERQNELHEVDRRRAQYDVQLQNLDEQAREKFRTPLEQLAGEAGEIAASREELVSQIAALRGRIESMGEVNVIAIEEHRQLSQRYEFLLRQKKDLDDAKASLRKTIRTIDETSTQMFKEGMTVIRGRFREIFRRLFGGGRADLLLTDPNDVLNTGIEIVAQPPGKQLQSITLLSGGEKALTAIALLFGIFLYRPSPFCVLDEVDAPLDDANIERFKNLVLEFSKDIQFIIITHNKQTMALADTLYGVTMEEPGVSRVVSVRFDEIEETALVG